jgi:dTDP-4-amino-4,6-dideoxygalactose transaminase
MNSEFIPLASPDIQEIDINAVAEVLRSGYLVQGPMVMELECILASYLNVKNVVMASNGTATLLLILKALGIGENDEVIVPAFSYIATANVVELVGAKPVFVDIDIETFNINKSHIEENITNQTKAIIIVHEFGLPADAIAIREICEAKGIHMIEDAACALGAKQGDIFAGNFGIAGSFSFHPRKAITSGEGGAIVTNDDILASKLRALRNHGIDPSSGSGIMSFIYAGYNYRMTDFQAALLISQMSRLDNILEAKENIAAKFSNRIINNKLSLPIRPGHYRHTWQTYHVMLDESLSQQSVITSLKNVGIGTNYGAQCIPDQTYYKNKYGLDSRNLFPNSYKAYTQGLAIPCYEKLNDGQISKIINEINKL